MKPLAVEFGQLVAPGNEKRSFAKLSAKVHWGAKVGVVAPLQIVASNFFEMLLGTRPFEGRLLLHEGTRVVMWPAEGGDNNFPEKVADFLEQMREKDAALDALVTSLCEDLVASDVAELTAWQRDRLLLAKTLTSHAGMILLVYPERVLRAMEIPLLGRWLEGTSATVFLATLDRAMLEDSVEMILELDPAFSRVVCGNLTLWSSEVGVPWASADGSAARRRLRKPDAVLPLLLSATSADEKRFLVEERALPKSMIDTLEKTFGQASWVSVSSAFQEQQSDVSAINYLGFEEPTQLLSQASMALRLLGFTYADLMSPLGRLSVEMRRRVAFVRAILLASGAPTLVLEFPEIGTTLPFLSFLAGVVLARRSPTVVITDERWLIAQLSPVAGDSSTSERSAPVSWIGVGV